MQSKTAKQNSAVIPECGSANGDCVLPARSLAILCCVAVLFSLGCNEQTSRVVRSKHVNNIAVGSADPSAAVEIDGLGTLTNAGKSLTIRWRMIDRELLNSLRQYGSLTELQILGVDRQALPLIECIAELEQLEKLSLVEVEVSDDELQILSGLSNLRSLELSQTGINGSGLRHLEGLPIRHLTLRESAVSATGMQSLAQFTELESLELVLPNFHLSALPSFAGLSKLETLWIGKGIYSYREHGGLNCLMGAQSIRELRISGWNLNDRALRVVGQLAKLELLEIGESQVSYRGLEHLAGLTRLESLSVPGAESEFIALSDRSVRLAKDEGFIKYTQRRQ